MVTTSLKNADSEPIVSVVEHKDEQYSMVSVTMSNIDDALNFITVVDG